MDRAIDPATLRTRRLRRGAVVAAVIVAVLLLLGAAPRLLTPTLRRGQFRTGVVSIGALETTLEASATVVPLVERVVSSPIDARIVRVKVRAGDTVRAGDELVELDTSATRLEAERLADRIAQQAAEAQRAAVDEERAEGALRGDLAARRLDLELAQSRALQYRKLNAEGLASSDTLHQAEVTLSKVRIEVAQLEDAITAAARGAKARRESLALDAAILAKEAGEVRHRLDLATARAEGEGVVTFAVATEGVTVQRGEVLARIADLSAFRVEAGVPDIHAGKIAPGMPVRLLLPGEPLAGRVDALRPAIENGSLRFSALLDRPGDPRLRHNQRADLLVVTGVRPGVRKVARGPALRPGAAVPVFVVREDSAERRMVRFGAAGRDEVEVEDGLLPGDEVIVSDTQDYAHLARVRVEGGR